MRRVIVARGKVERASELAQLMSNNRAFGCFFNIVQIHVLHSGMYQPGIDQTSTSEGHERFQADESCQRSTMSFLDVRTSTYIHDLQNLSLLAQTSQAALPFEH